MEDVLKQFLADAAELGATPEPERLATLVSDFALDTDYWSHQVTKADGANVAVHRQPDGPQVLLVRRTDGTMSAVHSHHVWVALSAIQGVETHRRYDIHHHDGDEIDAVLAEERHLHGGRGDVVTLVPPFDVHSHGHVRGTGDWPYTLIVLGDNQLKFQREEYDLQAGRRRVLPPGDRGTDNLPDPQG